MTHFQITLLFLIGAQLCAGEEIRGKVLDPARAAVPRAWVRLYLPNGVETRKTQATSEGDFVFDRLAAGEYMLEANAPGLSGVALARAGSALELLLEVERLAQHVVVTASATPLTVDATAKALDVIDYGEIERRAEYSVAEVLRQIPGMRVQQLGGPGSFTRVHTRGLRSFDTALLIDGFRMRDSASPQGDATAFLGDLLVVNPARIEVLRGSGSSLYGTHAIAGVVHLVTEQGGGPLHGEVSAEGGGLGMFRGVARLGGGAWRQRLQFSGGVAHLNVTGGVDGDDRARNTSGQGFVQLRLTPRSRLSMRLYASDAFSGLNSTPFAAPAQNLPSGVVPAIPLPPDQVALAEAGKPFRWGSATFAPSLNDPDSRRLGRFVSGLLGFTEELRGGDAVRLSYQRLGTSRDNRDGPGGVRFPPQFNNSALFDGRIDNAQARVDKRWGRQLLTAGYEFEREVFENVSRDENPDRSQRIYARTGIRQRSHSAFAQDQIRLMEGRLLISLSGRWQGFQLSKPVFEGAAPHYDKQAIASPPAAYTGDVAVAYLPRGTGTKLRAHAGNGYRAPALYERFGTFFFFGEFSPLGDPRLAPERSVAVDGGIDQYWAGSRVRTSATWFYTSLNHVIAFGALQLGQDPFGRFSGYKNTQGGLARGVELSGEAAVARNTRVQASYTYTRAQERTALFAGGLLVSPRIPNHMGTALFTQRLGKRFEWTVDVAVAGESMTPIFGGMGTRAFAFGGLKKADLAASYMVPFNDRHSLQLFTRVDNFLNQTWYEDGFRVPKALAVGGMRWLF